MHSHNILITHNGIVKLIDFGETFFITIFFLVVVVIIIIIVINIIIIIIVVVIIIVLVFVAVVVVINTSIIKQVKKIPLSKLLTLFWDYILCTLCQPLVKYTKKPFYLCTSSQLSVQCMSCCLCWVFLILTAGLVFVEDQKRVIQSEHEALL